MCKSSYQFPSLKKKKKKKKSQWRAVVNSQKSSANYAPSQKKISQAESKISRSFFRNILLLFSPLKHKFLVSS